MRTIDPDSAGDLWSRRIDAAELDPDDTERWDHGITVVVTDLEASTIDRVGAVLDVPTLDGVEIDVEVDRGSACAVVALMRECASRDIPVEVEFAAELDPCATEWEHLLSRPPGRPLRFDLARRHGPGFVQIVDDRPGRYVRITFDDPIDVGLIGVLERPVAIAGLDARDRERLAVLTQFDLVLEIDGDVVLVAPRIKRWPVPLDDLFDPPTA